jgi:3-hydroxyisobutyrate dehydrogenase-like beta-hydroxyacid dehydrogenase
LFGKSRYGSLDVLKTQNRVKNKKGGKMADKGRVAFIGLGVMGYPMAGHLANSGWDVRVFNRSAEKSAKWTEKFKGTHHGSPAEASQNCDFVMMCVGNDDDLRSVVYGDRGVLSGMSSGSILVDHTTTSALVAREVAKVAEQRDIGFVDAPVSGGQAGAENGVLTIMAGAEPEVFGKAVPVMRSYGKTIVHMGAVGNGQLTKMVNQICIAGLVQALSEGLNFASLSGLDAKKVVEAISGGAAQSWQMDNRASTMIDGKFDFGFAVDWMRKDLGICLEEAKQNGALLPVTAVVDQFYGQVQARGGNRWDTSSLITNLKNDA